MTDDAQPARCFRCGGPAHELNEIEEGVNCPACAERLIESVQGVFHTPWADPVVSAGAAAEHEHELVEERVERGPRRVPRGPTWSDDQGPRRA
jgi:hypothetical protein